MLRGRGADREAKEKAKSRGGSGGEGEGAQAPTSANKRTSRKMAPKAAQAAGGSGLCLDE